ncbi:hypothetical protein [Nocardioides rubriscoriae]|uniref:hypothetical protein n=1 Tax=Nocardioides rubriscoriae TaxID=642762 RepID=UPI0011DF2300|nr:hypothetical protein [Nocardioides rubriscoriae]
MTEGMSVIRSRAGLMSCAALATTVALFVVPALLISWRGYDGEDALVAAAESAFRRADLGARVADSAALAELTARWREFHVVKALLAGVLVAVLAGLASVVRRKAEATDGGRGRWPLLAAYSGVALWLLAAVSVLLANVQGSVAPFASVASLLPTERPGGELGGVLASLRQAVQADPPRSGAGIPGELLGDFVVYHAVLAVLALATGGVLMTLALRAVLARSRLHAEGRSPRPTWLLQTTLYGAAGAFFVLLALANTSTWIDPVPALVATLGGG